MNSKRSCCLSSISLFNPLNGKSAVLIASTAFLAATSGLMAQSQRPGAQPERWRNTATGKPVLQKQPGTAAPEGPAPVNDNCAAASPILNGNTAYDNSGATTDGPAHASCLFFGDDQVGSDIWYDYVATESNTLLVSLCGSGYDTKVAIYSGCGCPVADGNLLACNDDFCGLQSFLSTPVIAGNCYKIRVGGYAAGQGSGNISLSYPAPLNNDNCVDRLDVFDGVTPFDTSAATTDGPSHGACLFFGDPQVNQDIWFNYTASQDGFLRLETCGSGFDTKLAAYAGCNCPVGDANLIACNDDSCGLQSVIQFNVLLGDCIKIRLGGYLGATGQGQLTISYGGGGGPCPNPKHPCNVTGGPGCSDEACCNIVCASDPFCCDVEWDGLCVNGAAQLCGGGGNPCPNPEHSCDVTGGPGCSDEACCNVVCASDPFCCDVAWDGLCVQGAANLCGGPCAAECPPGALLEEEPCGADLNGGCNSIPIGACQPIQCNDQVCGTYWAEFGTRDTDWYCFTLTQPSTEVTWSVVAEFPALVFLVSLDCQVIGAQAGTCPWTASATLGPGTYYAFVSPPGFEGLPCGGGNNDYVGTLIANCAPPCRGDINGDGTVDMDDLLLLLRDWGPCPQ